ncbi:M12 family metallo-peptidase [Mobilicoccus pelagius]|nr:M12 family metallo-peptidase [Mobilicoccus pelagius]
MREHRWIVTLGVVAAMGSLLAPAAHATGAEETGAKVTVEGVVERLADVTSGVDAAVRLPDGERLPLRDADSVGAGDRVRLTVPVPADAVADIRAGRRVEGTDVVVDRAELRAATRRPAPSGSGLSDAVVGHLSDEGTPVAGTGAVVLAPARTAQGASAPAVHALTVAVVRPKGVQGTVATAAQVASQVGGADAYWREQSRGAVSLRLGSVSKPYASAYSCSDSPFSMWTEAARATGFTEGDNRHLVVLLPRSALDAGCSYGLASMGGQLSTGGVVYVSDTSWPVLAHEIGHNLGLSHAKGLHCRSVTDANLGRLAAGCSLEEYGDPHDVMSASAQDNAGSLSLPQAVRVGLADTRDYVDVTGGTRTLTLRPVSGLTGVRAARIRDPRSGAVYWVEYRDRTRRDARLYTPMAAGVRVLREEPATADSPWPATVSLDASPTGAANDASWALPAGSTFTTYGGGVGVTVTGVRGGAVAVEVVVASGARAVGTPGRVTRASAPVSRPAVKKAGPATPKVSIDNRGVVSWKSGTRGVRYDAAIRTVKGRAVSTPRTWYSKTTRTSAQLKGARGTTVHVRVRAVSGGTGSAWSGWHAVAFG